MNLFVLFTCAACFPMQDAAKPAKPQPATVNEVGFEDWTYVPNHQVFNEVYAAVDGGMPKTVDEAIALALQMHPDIRLAEAEMRVAEAKLAQARLLVTQKVTQDYQRLKEAQAELAKAEASFARVQEQSKKGEAKTDAVSEINQVLLQAKSQVARQESLWKLVIPQLNTASHRYLWLRQPNATIQDYQGYLVNGGTFKVNLNVNKDAASVLEQLKEHLDKSINLEKQSKLELSQAFARLGKEAGFNLRVRLPATENKDIYTNITKLELDAAQLPLHTWFQLIVDETNNMQSMLSTVRNDKPKRYELYVREYGLLLTTIDLAPPDAKTVQELWKQVRSEKAVYEQREKLRLDQSKTAPQK